MPTIQTAGRAAITAPTRPTADVEWRCTSCRQLLGVHRDGELHIRFARGHEYLTALPARCTCRGCGTLNRTSAPHS